VGKNKTVSLWKRELVSPLNSGVEGFNILPRSAGPLLLKKEDKNHCLPLKKGAASNPPWERGEGGGFEPQAGKGRVWATSGKRKSLSHKREKEKFGHK
jgi:hypothetical protein